MFAVRSISSLNNAPPESVTAVAKSAQDSSVLQGAPTKAKAMPVDCKPVLHQNLAV
ncbi:hypothetical protein [Polynucleobacter sp. TUM22923]|uniref:hypothetical protein n=1 Tax=Polynucleobacter sp. TUM22923 TaxID=3022126 RepID=UPI002573F3EB|nr:hypothetical protein [Polynucleobacter sp. TUM22923]